MAPKQTPRLTDGGSDDARGRGRQKGFRVGCVWGGTKENLNEQKQFCHHKQIQLKSLLDWEELELSDQAMAMKGSERAKLASGVGFPWPVIGSHIVLARHLAIFKYNGRNECK